MLQMDYLEFVGRVTSHIPDEGQVMVRYYGLYVNAHQEKVRAPFSIGWIRVSGLWC